MLSAFPSAAILKQEGATGPRWPLAMVSSAILPILEHWVFIRIEVILRWLCRRLTFTVSTIYQPYAVNDNQEGFVTTQRIRIKSKAKEEAG